MQKKCCSCVVHVLSVDSCLKVFIFYKKIAYTGLKAVEDLLNTWTNKQTSVA
jgi:hypothetical protein